jgi:hypothetical protein
MLKLQGSYRATRHARRLVEPRADGELAHRPEEQNPANDGGVWAELRRFSRFPVIGSGKTVQPVTRAKRDGAKT